MLFDLLVTFGVNPTGYISSLTLTGQNENKNKKMKQKSLSRRSFEGVLNRNMRCQKFLTAMLIAVSIQTKNKQK